MGERCGYWSPKQQQFDWLSPNLKSSVTPPHIGHQTGCCDIGTGKVSASGKFPLNANLQLPYLRVGQLNLSNCGLNGASGFQQGSTPAQKFLPEHLPANILGYNPKNLSCDAGSGCAPKRFLVFDHSGDQTTLVFSSAFGMPVQWPYTWSRKPSVALDLNEEDPKSKGFHNIGSEQLSEDVFYENGADVHSEMHEDTEELNALLYSDGDSDYTEEDEVTSTGHSPSTMTSHDEEIEGHTEEVASSFERGRKRKLFDDANEFVPSLHCASLKRNRIGSEDDAESSCNGMNPVCDDIDRKLRKDKIRETVGVLRNMIPGGDGKDALVVIDEAIEFLKSLKLKAKTLGLNSL